VRYVEELIGPDTVNTMPPATLAAFRDHGQARASLTEDMDYARETVSRLAEAGLSLTATTDALLADGIHLFADAYRRLLEAVERQSRRTVSVTR
jgi:transaldolase / glucose-6-phosphate isomerase